MLVNDRVVERISFEFKLLCGHFVHTGDILCSYRIVKPVLVGHWCVFWFENACVAYILSGVGAFSSSLFMHCACQA